jgi:hypothetical protein
MKTVFGSLTCLFLACTSHYSQAALYDRGNGFIYDEVLDITWLQDANYANTTNATPWYRTGWMVYDDAVAWTDSLNLAGTSDWRLPSAGENPSMGWSSDSELGHMFYNNLGNSGSVTNTTFIDGETGLSVSFENIQNTIYWLSEELPENKVWTFKMEAGKMLDYASRNSGYHIWAVHDGDIANNIDVAAVPVPASAFLFGSALLGLMVTRRQSNP